MAGKTDYTENNLRNFIFRGVTFPVPAALYVGLFTTAPAENGSGGVEVTGGSYARVSVPRTTGAWKDPATAVQGLTENLAEILFPTASANWGTVVAGGVWDAITGGNLLYFGNMGVSKIVNNADVFKFVTGDFEITED